jgi:hypothetical protein
MTTAMAVFAPVSSPLLPPVPLLELSFARAAAEEEAAAASSALVGVEDAALVAVSLGWLLVVVRVTTTVLPLEPSAGLVGVWVITDVRICVVGSAEGAVDVEVTSDADSAEVVSSAVVSAAAEEVDDVVSAAEVVSSVEVVMGVEMELVRLLDVVTVVKAPLVDDEDMAAAAVVVSGSVSVRERQHTGRVGHDDGKQAIASTTGCGRVGFDCRARRGVVEVCPWMVECDGRSDMQGGRVGRLNGSAKKRRSVLIFVSLTVSRVTKESWLRILARSVCMPW